MPMSTSGLRNSAPAPLPVTDVGPRVKFATRGSRISESSMETDARRQRITFVGQKQESVPRLCEAPSSVSRGEWYHAEAVPELSYDLGALGSVTATITGRVCRTLVEHCKESNLHGREVGGLLVGHRGAREIAGKSSEAREYNLLLTNAIPICSFDSSSDHLSFTEGAWTRAVEEIREKYVPEGKIRLGWYHTHPDQGIFFSSKDQTAHGIFAEPYQIALVVDPRGMETGLFHWARHADKFVAGPICFSLVRRRK
jgi:proteasome lid subunit RPN8/RPN11